MWPGQGIAQKIRRWFLCIALIPLLVIGVFCVRYMRASLWDDKQNEIARSIVEREIGLKALASTYRTRQRIFAANKQPQDFLFQFNQLHPKDRAEFLKKAREVLSVEVEEFLDLSGFVAIRITGKDGRELFKHQRRGAEGIFPKGDTHWRGPDDAPVHFFRGADGQAYIMVSGAVFQHSALNREAIGAMTLITTLDEAEGILSASSWPIFLFDPGEKVLTGLPTTVNKNLIPASIIKKGVQGETGIAQAGRHVIVYRHLRETGGALVTLIDRKEVFAPITQLTNAFVFGGVITVIIVLLLSSRASKKMVKPVKQLLLGVEAVAAGNLEERVAVATGDEIESLGRRFNEMVDKIKARNKDLTDLKYALDQAAIVAVTDKKGVIQYVNDRFCEISKYSREELIGQDHRIISSGSHSRDFIRSMWETIEKGDVWRGQFKNKARNGSFYWVDSTIVPFLNDDGRPYQYLAIRTDITQRKVAEEKVLLLAQYDDLTKLPNRALFNERLDQTVKQRAWGKKPFAVMFIDLDRFKLVNDTLGHAAGDALLQQVSARLTACLRAEDTVARIGGDEFTVLLPAIAKKEDAFLVARKIVAALVKPFSIASRELLATGSIGVSLYPDHGEDGETLLKHADDAMYRSKENGRGQFNVFVSRTAANPSSKLDMITALSQAIDRDELFLHYQPLVELKQGKVIGVEALIRWEREGVGMVSPAEFIPLAEETGLILSVGDWVMRAAAAQLKLWQENGFPDLSLAVNVSAPQFKQADFVAQVSRVIEETGIGRNTLKLELTESLLMKDQEEVIKRLKELKALGTLLAIDDFGTGYSSLSYLKRFPVDTLKIDQSFIRNISKDPDDAAIAETIMTLARQLKLNVVAEGVETGAQLMFLRARGCDVGQGYLFSRPVSGEACTSLLKKSAWDNTLNAQLFKAEISLSSSR
ncbi:MAG: putative bifunctional diguanylate cyclase/phosphodiesterase [Nitrospiria bacterium]